jgi:hypothetical protein
VSISPNSFYPEKIIKSDPPNMASRATKQSVASKGSGDKDDDKRREEVMREFVREYSRDVTFVQRRKRSQEPFHIP